MDKKMFDLWSVNRQKGKSKFVLAYGFTATLIGLLVLLIGKAFIFIENLTMVVIMIAVGIAGTLLGSIVWNVYDKQYLGEIGNDTEKQE